MKNKMKIGLILLGLINFATCLSLLILVVPSTIPATITFSEKISSNASKWILIIPTVAPIIIATLALIFNKNAKVKFSLITLFVLSLYESIIFFTYFSTSQSMNIGALHEVPISLSVFLPLSFIFLILSFKLKDATYKSKPAINFKCTRETEFIWKQTHFFARDAYAATSVLFVLTSIVFAFVRIAWVELIIFVVGIIVSTIIVYAHSKSLYNKYMEMKNRRDNLKQNNKNKQ